MNRSHSPPTSASGKVIMMSAASANRRNVRYRRTKMIARMKGTTSFSFLVARSRYSNCPDQLTEYPAGSSICRPIAALASDRQCNHLLYIGKAQAEASRLRTIDPNFDVPAAAHTFGVSGSGAGDLLDRSLDLLADRVDHLQIGARDLDADRALDAGREH